MRGDSSISGPPRLNAPVGRLSLCFFLSFSLYIALSQIYNSYSYISSFSYSRLHRLVPGSSFCPATGVLSGGSLRDASPLSAAPPAEAKTAPFFGGGAAGRPPASPPLIYLAVIRGAAGEHGDTGGPAQAEAAEAEGGAGVQEYRRDQSDDTLRTEPRTQWLI